jgi:hypothetical protein
MQAGLARTELKNLMPDYSGGGGAGAGADLEAGAGGGKPTGETMSEGGHEDAGGREDTFFLPPDFPGSEALKPGDMLNLRVVGKDAQGGIEVEHVAGAEGDMPDWKKDLRNSVQSTPGMGMGGGEPPGQPEEMA